MKILLFLLLISIFNHSMSQKQSDTLEKYTFDVQGHRGARGLAPENSLPAFKKALSLGVNTLRIRCSYFKR